MLTIYPQKDAGRAKNYFWGYYSEGGQELPGTWGGTGAAKLGLAGEIERKDWDALVDNKNPNTGETLTVRQKEGRRILYDFTWSAPKSVSLLYGLTRDERVLDAFRASVNETMAELESEMQVRVRHSGKMEDRTTGSMIFGHFTHLTARPVDGIPDPGIHSHIAVMNSSFDSEENRWKAGQFVGLLRDRKYFQSVFHSKLSRKLEELGLETKRTATGWDFAGLEKSTLDKFSRRREQIEARARELDITDKEAKRALIETTRGAKIKDLNMDELEKTWRSWLTDSESGQIERLAKRVGSEPIAEDEGEAARAVGRAVAHSFARKSALFERELLAEAIQQGYGKVTRERIEAEMKKTDLIRVKRKDGRMWVTTRAVLEEEERMLDFARRGRGTCAPSAPARGHTNREWLNPGQRRAVGHVLSSTDRVMAIRGAAGVGKTASLQEIHDAVKEQGGKVFAVAPSAPASRGELRREGFETANTVATLLKNEKLQEEIHGSLLMVDEASMVGAADMKQLFDLAERENLRVLLVGDLRQHGSVARGSALKLIEEQAGIAPVAITEIMRQKPKAYKAAIAELSEGNVAKGFRLLDAQGAIHEIDSKDRYQALATAYADSVQAGKSSLVVSPTHAEGRKTTQAIRRELRTRGLLGVEERTFEVLRPAQFTPGEKMDPVSYVPGDVLAFHQNAAGGIKKGQRLTVQDGAALPLSQIQHFEVFHPEEIQLSVGDRVRVTQGGKTKDQKHALNNGDLFTVKAFTKSGDLVVQNDRQKKAGKKEAWTVSKDFGHLALGHTVTSHASQGKTVDHVFIAQSSQSFAASSAEQWYVSASRGRHQVHVFTDDKKELLEAVKRTDDRISATELVGYDPQEIIRRRLIEQREYSPPVLVGERSREWEVDLER